MQLIETTISEKAIRVRFADHADAAKATEWFEAQVVPGEYVFGELKLSEGPDRMPLGAIRLAALQRAQAVIADEMKRLSQLVGRSG